MKNKKQPASYNVTAAMWSQKLINKLDEFGVPANNRKVTKFVNTFDFVPTLFDMLGIDYNPHMYLGINAFETTKNIIISRLNVIFDDKFSSDGFYILYADPKSTEQDAQVFKFAFEAFTEKWSYVNNLFLTGNLDYFD